jgi:hypothetical protein
MRERQRQADDSDDRARESRVCSDSDGASQVLACSPVGRVAYSDRGQGIEHGSDDALLSLQLDT